MKNLYKLMFVAALMVLPGIQAAKAQVNMGSYVQETECVGVELDGSLTLVAWGSGRNRNDAVKQARKIAVRDVLFKGITKGMKVPDPRPLVPEVNAERKYADYFNKFFSDKKAIYQGYTQDKDERIVDRIIRDKAASSEGVTYKVTVRVLRADLKQRLIDDGIIK
jgi:hypothetical protein